jgi:hypothetical protein
MKYRVGMQEYQGKRWKTIGMAERFPDGLRFRGIEFVIEAYIWLSEEEMFQAVRFIKDFNIEAMEA